MVIYNIVNYYAHILDGHAQRLSLKGSFTCKNWSQVCITSGIILVGKVYELIS